MRAAPAALPMLRLDYEHTSLDALLAADDVLAVLGFGPDAPATHADPRYLRVALETQGDAPFEVWRTRGPIRAERHDTRRGAVSPDYAFGAIELDEAMHGGLEAAAKRSYQLLTEQLARSTTPHVLRIWNYLDAINLGADDDERYRQFCSGRAAGIRGRFGSDYPAATAIGVRDGRRVLQIYWLAAREAGAIVENPRQVSAWRYPRRYGPDAPNFARAMRAPTQFAQVYISGTAAIIGHASRHDEDFAAQFAETLTNIDSVRAAARGDARAHDAPLLKVYVRRDKDLDAARELLAAHLPASRWLLLRGDICRRELLVEIEGVDGT